MTKSKRLGIIHPEAPERGLTVGKEWLRAINLAGPGHPGCLVPHWVCTGGPFHQPPPSAAPPCSACKKSPVKREMCRREGKEALHGFMASFSLPARSHTE